MKKFGKSLLVLLLAVALVLANQIGLIDLGGSQPAREPSAITAPQTEAQSPAVPQAEEANQPQAPPADKNLVVTEDGTYTSRDEVALYIHQYGHLPGNFITKKEAEDLGWVNSQGNLWKVAPGMSIGGDYFGNYEGSLPKAKGRKYYECDIGFNGKFRNAQRILFSNDGLIYYTDDHYETFTLLYGRDQ